MRQLSSTQNLTSMKHSLLRQIGSVLALTAALAVSGVQQLAAVAGASSAELLAAELPAGVTISSAPTPILATALKGAIRKKTDQAVPLLRVALLSRGKKKASTDASKGGQDFSKGGGARADADVVELTRAAIEAAPDQAQALVEEAIAIAPGSASALQSLLGGGDFNAPLGGGFTGPGFVGAPGFVGSGPGGGSFNPTTPVTNR